MHGAVLPSASDLEASRPKEPEAAATAAASPPHRTGLEEVEELLEMAGEDVEGLTAEARA